MLAWRNKNIIEALVNHNIPLKETFLEIFPKYILAFLIVCLCLAWADSDAKLALIITIDGLRPDALSETHTPNLYSLITLSSYTLNAKTIQPSKTIPAHTSLITGLTPERHNTLFDTWNEAMGYIEVDTIFCIVENRGMKTAMFVGKDKLGYLVKPGCVDHFVSSGTSNTTIQDIESKFSKYFKKEKPQLTLLHFPEPDLTGHKDGWMTDEYFTALKNVDAAIGKVIETINATGAYNQTLIVITSDHGGKGKSHKGAYEENIKIPWMALGDRVKHNHKIKKQVLIYDTAPTVLSALGIELPKDLDGIPIKEIFESN
jgi:predicted AlkP superfamily pyrophosphatase or phosphodiesterase